MVRRTVLLLLPALAMADKWAAFGEKEWKNGPHRLVISEKGFRLLAGDKIVAEGKLPQLPLDVHVLAGAPGAVLFERYGAIGYGDTLALLGADGNLRWRLSLEEAIPGGSGGAPVSVSSIRWNRAWRVDEKRGVVLLVARNGVLSAIDLKTGQRGTLDAAVEAAVEMAPEGLREAGEKLLVAGSLAPATRLRAAVAVEKAGGRRVTREAWEAALADPEAIGFASRHVADLDLVVEAALRKDVGYQAVEALGERGAVEVLAGLLTHGSIDPGVRDRAAQALGRQAPEKAIDAIDREMRDAGPAEGGALLTAAIATGAAGLERRFQHHESVLLLILDKETADVGWLADYFKGRPTSEAVKPLVRSLARHKGDPALRKRLIAALKPCSGEDHGDDADAWVKALAARR